MSQWKYLVVVFLREDFAEQHKGDTDQPLENLVNFKMTSKKFAVDKSEVRKIIAEVNEENRIRTEARKSIGANKHISKSYKGKMYANNFGKLHWDVVRLSDKETITESFKMEKTAKSINARRRRQLKSGQL